MTDDRLLELFRQALALPALASAPVLIAGLAAGAMVGWLAAAWRTDGSAVGGTLRLAAAGTALFLFGAGMLGLLVRFASAVFRSLTEV